MRITKAMWAAECCTDHCIIVSKLNIRVQPKRRSDSIPAEILKVGGTALTGKLLTLVQIIWEKESVPQDFKDASIIHLYKRKGHRQACDNHRRISLLSIAGKIVAKVLLSKDSYQKVSEASGKIAGLSRWCSLPDSSKRNVKNRTLTCTPPLSI